MRIFTRKTKLYPGDKTVQIRVEVNQGSLGLMNLTPIYFNSKKQYSNDINGFIFETITKAKQYCRKNLLVNIPAKEKTNSIDC